MESGAERLFGYTAPEAIGQPVTMLIPPGRLDEEPRILERIRRGERIDHYETVRRRKDGTLLHISLCVSPVTDTHGTIVGASKIARDITERKQAAETVRQRTVQFETLLNAAPLGVYLVDADFRMRQVNPTALSVFGDMPALIGRDFEEVLHRLWSPADADDIVRCFRHTLATGEPYMTPEWSAERRDRGVTEYSSGKSTASRSRMAVTAWSAISGTSPPGVGPSGHRRVRGPRSPAHRHARTARCRSAPPSWR